MIISLIPLWSSCITYRMSGESFMLTMRVWQRDKGQEMKMKKNKRKEKKCYFVILCHFVSSKLYYYEGYSFCFKLWSLNFKGNTFPSSTAFNIHCFIPPDAILCVRVRFFLDPFRTFFSSSPGSVPTFWANLNYYLCKGVPVLHLYASSSKMMY